MAGLLANLPFFKKEPRKQPPVDPTDEVIPVHVFDDQAPARGIVFAWTFKFDEVLDTDKVHDALSQLLQMHGWRKFSGRFRYRDDGSLELHVPKTFTADRPAVHFSQETHNIPMAKHPLASKIPRANGSIALFDSPKELCALALTPDTPRNIDDFVFSGAPQFWLRTQSFTDGTLVSITHSHVSTDVVGLACIFEAWSLVLAGKRDQVKPLVGYRDDPFDGLRDTPPKEKHVLEHKVLDGWRFKYWGLRSLLESWRYADVQSRVLCLPRHTMEKLMTEARSHIQTDGVALPGTPKPFISEGDVLTALASRMLAQYQNPGSTRQMGTIMAVDPRTRLRSIFRPDSAYVQNSPTNLYFFVRADQAIALPLGQLALKVRETIATQTSEDQLNAAVALSRESMKTSQMPVIFGEKDMATQFMSNWTKGKLAENLDFTPAIVSGSDKGGSNGKKGHPVYYSCSDPGHNNVSVISSVFVVMEKDFEGNNWLSISVPGKMWTDLMAYLKQYE